MYVSFGVTVERRLDGERAAAEVTGVRLLTSVNADVTHQVAALQTCMQLYMCTL